MMFLYGKGSPKENDKLMRNRFNLHVYNKDGRVTNWNKYVRAVSFHGNTLYIKRYAGKGEHIPSLNDELINSSSIQLEILDSSDNVLDTIDMQYHNTTYNSFGINDTEMYPKFSLSRLDESPITIEFKIKVKVLGK